MIQDYLDLLARELDFDRSLSRRVRQEVEDHLWESVAARPADEQLEAQRCAVANFGDARAIAAQFAVISLARHSRRAGAAVPLMIVAVLIAMKARIAWYVAAQWTMGDDMRSLGALVLQIDRYAFWLSVAIGLGGWLYIRSRRMPAAFNPAYRRQLDRFFLLCGGAAAALVVCVVSDAVLTALQLRGTSLSTEWLIPVVSMAIEIACVGFLAFHLRAVTLLAACTAALQKA
jgi:hypothetical protein